MNMNAIDWSVFWPPVRLSLQVALLSSVIAVVVGVAVAWKMSRTTFRGKIFLETILMLPLVLPPTVVGFLLLVILGRRSLLGRWIEAIFSAPVIFVVKFAVIASVVVAFPLVYQTMKSGFNGVDRDLEDAGRSIGANEWQVFRYITLPLAGRALMTAFILGFARALGSLAQH